MAKQAQLKAEDFEMQYDSKHHFSFFESEDGTILAWGHRDRDSFLDEVLAYDRLCTGDPFFERGNHSDVQHRWALLVEWAGLAPHIRLVDTGWEGLGAVPVTVWQRA